MASSSLDVEHVQAKFFTTQTQYSIPDSTYSLPVSASAKELNNIIHSVLLNEHATINVEFDFLINGEYLRSSLEVHLEDKDISAETVIEIEYVERQAAPRPETSIAHDDWVSCVRGNGNLAPDYEKLAYRNPDKELRFLGFCQPGGIYTIQRILCGCYDNTLRLWTREGVCQTTIPGHTGPVKCVTWVNSTQSDSGHVFASGSHDQTLFVWRWKELQKEVDCMFACKGHAGSVDCVAAHPDGARILTGSWDKMIKLWSTVDVSTIVGDAEEVEESSRKKKKLKSDGQKVTTCVPLVTLSGHKEAVSSATWLDESKACTSSWDHTLRVWDMSRAEQTEVVEGAKAIFSIAFSPLSRLVVSASADRHVRLHDLRTKEMKGTYSSHTAWVSSVDWSRTNEYLFLSGSHDMVMKLWDSRSPRAPLYNMVGQEDKILAVDWSIPDLMLSGGADNQLKIFNYQK